MSTGGLSKRWWVGPLLFTLALALAWCVVWRVSETAREVLSKAILMIAGALATPFILETSLALFGLVLVIVINQWRLQKEGDGWVYLAQTEPSTDSGAATPPHRLDAVVLQEKPASGSGLEVRLTALEGYLELGLKAEALAGLRELTTAERALPRVQALEQALQD